MQDPEDAGGSVSDIFDKSRSGFVSAFRDRNVVERRNQGK
jgi:hypothetical protein